MNKNHRIIWNDVRGCFVVASEKTKSRGKPSTTRTAIATAVAALLLAPGMAAAVCSDQNPVTGMDHLTATQCYTNATAVIQSGGSIIDSQLMQALGIGATNTSLSNAGLVRANVAPVGLDSPNAVDALAIRFVDGLAGSLSNTGTIEALVTDHFANNVYATGVMIGGVDEYSFVGGDLSGSLTNSNTINVVASSDMLGEDAGTSPRVHAVGIVAGNLTEDGVLNNDEGRSIYVSASATGEDAEAYADGISLAGTYSYDSYSSTYSYAGGNLAGSLTNSGTITAMASAMATAGEDVDVDVDATASARGIYVGGELSGSLDNKGTIIATATATADGTYAATAAGEDASSAVYADVDAYARAYGVAAGSLGVGASLTNEGTITAVATATADGTYAATAAGEDAYSAAYGDVYAYAGAYGVVAGSLGAGASFTNEGTITATATATADGTYTATTAGEGAYSLAYGDVDAYASAYGVAISSLGAGASFTNEGTITATATATAEGTYTAGEDAYSLAYGEVDAYARAYGVAIGSLGAGASFINKGTGVIEATATANGSDYAYAAAYGVRIGYLGEDASLTNSGTISATATANGEYGYAAAYGVYVDDDLGGKLTNSGTISATAIGTGEDTYATGVYVGEDLAGMLTNESAGKITATVNVGEDGAGIVAAATGVYVEGYLHGTLDNKGTITASVNAGEEGAAYDFAYATGVYVGEELDGTLTNSGKISATATAGEDAYAYAYGVDVVALDGELINKGEIIATATAGEDAYAYGINVNHVGEDATLTNSGKITADATVTSGEAEAYGIRIGGFQTLLGALTNESDGVIEVTATATGEDAYAYAYGVSVIHMGEGATLTNDGKITATATANDVARAYGVYVGEADLGGLLTNTGTITATAMANGEDAYAYGVYVGGDLNGTLTNTGTIEGIADDPAKGYSLHVGSGIPQSIHNEAGGVMKGNLYVGGDVAVYNAGLISIPAGAHGEIEGNYTQQTGGVLEIGVTDGYAPDGEGGYDHDSGDNGGSMYASLDVGGTADLSASSTIAVRVKPVNSLDKGDKLNNVLNAPSGEDGLLLASGSAAEGDTVKVIGTPLFIYRGVVDAYNNVDIYIDDARTFAETLGSQGNSSIAGIGSTLDGLHNDYVEGMNGEDHNPGPMGDLIDSLYGLNSVDELNRAAQSLTPLIASDMGQATQGVMRDMNRIIQARQDGNRGLSSGEQFYGDRNFWFKPFGSRADQKQRGGVPGYRAKSYGMAFGADAVISNATRIGAAFTYANSDVDTKSTLRQWGDVDSYQLAFYGSHSLDEKTDVNFQVDFGHHKNDVGRNVLVPTPTVAKGSFNAWSSHIGAGVGRVYALSESTSLTPSVRADYSYLRTKGYTESGAGLVSLMVNGFKVDELILSADGKLNHDLGGGASFIANLGLGYDALGDRTSITSSFVGGGAAFATQGIDPSKWLVRGGLGLVMKKDKSYEITARYDVEGRSNFTNQTASLKLRLPF